jgi:hypothetical protein
MGAQRAAKRDRSSSNSGAYCRQRGALRGFRQFLKQFQKVNSRNFICEILHTPMRRAGDLGSAPPEYLRQRPQVEQREHVEGRQPHAER